MKCIKNCPVTTDVYGPDVASLKGKNVHRCTAAVVNDVIKTPREMIAS